MGTMTAHKPVPRARTRNELWQDTIDTSLDDPRWHEYDADIACIVGEFNHHLCGARGYLPLDWRMIKAIIWTESGGPGNRAWPSDPMQIGDPADPRLHALLSGKDGGELVMPAALRNRLSLESAASSAQMNIRAGTAYLLMRLARYDAGTVPDATDSAIYEVSVASGDSFDKIARANGTTIDTLKKCNPGTLILRPGQTLQYQKAAVRKIIAGWNLATTSNIALRYNMGDPGYARKLDYSLAAMRKSKVDHAIGLP